MKNKDKDKDKEKETDTDNATATDKVKEGLHSSIWPRQTIVSYSAKEGGERRRGEEEKRGCF